MKRYEYVTVKTGGVFDYVLKGYKEVIDEYAKKGYRYAGYLPTATTSSGGLLEIQLIFEIDDNN